MPAPDSSPKLVQFGVFELDPQRLELRKQGLKVKLQEQPLKILRLLLESPGQIVNREQLRSRIWPADTFVEFDKGLYSAMARLRDALGDSSASPRFIETVARHGYRFIAPVTQLGLAPALPLDTPDKPGIVLAPAGRRFVLSLLAGLLGGALLLALLLTFNLAGTREWLYSQTHPIRSLAVLPLENLSGDPEQEYFADGMTDELITTLAKLGSFRVVSRTSVMRFKKVSKPLAQVAQELSVDAVVEGTVERVGSHVRIRVQLIHADTDRHLWAQTYDRELRDTLLLQSEAARDIAQQIQFRLDSDRRPPAPPPRQVNPQAYEAYLHGLYFSNKRSTENFTRAINYFQQAISIDPSYAAAYSGLSNALLGEMFTGTPHRNVREQATFAAMKSIDLDPNLPESHDTLGGIHEFYEWDWSAAEHEY
ncbi:MAG TPA: winged helix-turn-helix domain-containing protein, partial [Terriglobales bacterium]|nr:winged helix-turn-helix domain-containing protein [Terriglobales bacterium]